LSVDPQTIASWLRRLVLLDLNVFEDIRANPSATIPGIIVVAVSCFLSGVGGWLWWVLRGLPDGSDVFLRSAVIGSLIALVLWTLAWVGLVYVMLTQVFRERVFLEQLLRVMGLATAPLALTLLMFIPGVSLGIGIAALALTFGLTTIAIQMVTTADSARVLVANLAGFTLWACVLTLLVRYGDPYAPGIFLFNAPADIASDLFELGEQLDFISVN
jgi:hypothetical protein